MQYLPQGSLLPPHIGFEKIDSQRDAYNHLLSNKRAWHNCFIQSNQKILLDLADFALPEQPEDNLMVVSGMV